MTRTHDPSRFLRRALLGNATFSVVSGITLIAAAGPLARLIGVSQPARLIGVGIGLLGFAATLARNARSGSLSVPEARLAVVMDLAWVMGSVALVLTRVLEPAGNWVVAGVAEVVLVFALLQMLGLRRLRRAASA